jgi:hypothetical protein
LALGRVIEKVSGKLPLHTYWKCVCDCGTERIVNAMRLRSGRSKSCGCLKGTLIAKKRNHNGLEPIFNLKICSYKSRAKKKKLEWSLTDEQVVNLFKGNCHYCGCEPNNRFTGGRLKGVLIYSGIDRIDNSLGYTAENTVSCCKIDNHAKDVLTYKEYIDHIMQVASHVGAKNAG